MHIIKSLCLTSKFLKLKDILRPCYPNPQDSVDKKYFCSLDCLNEVTFHHYPWYFILVLWHDLGYIILIQVIQAQYSNVKSRQARTLSNHFYPLTNKNV